MVNNRSVGQEKDKEQSCKHLSLSQKLFKNLDTNVGKPADL